MFDICHRIYSDSGV